MEINMSTPIETLQAAEVLRFYWKNCNEANKVAVAEYNKRIERAGLPLAKYRTF